jgi:hypothetical protein
MMRFHQLSKHMRSFLGGLLAALLFLQKYSSAQ